MSRKLKLPVIKEKPVKNRLLSMDEFLEFVDFNLENSPNLEEIREFRKKESVDVRFKLYPSSQSK